MRKIKLSLISGFALGMAVCTNGYAEPIIPQTPTLNSNNAEMRVRFFSGNEPKIDYRKVFNHNFTMDINNLYFGNFLEGIASATKLNFIVDKDVNLVRNTYNFYQNEQPFRNTFENILKAECLTYQAITNRDNFINQMRIYPVPTDTLLIYPNSNQKNCNQADDLEKLTKYFPKLDFLLGMDLEKMNSNKILGMISSEIKLNIIYQNTDSIYPKYKINVRDKSASSIFKATLNANCLNYRKLNDNTMLIFKDPYQKDCTPLPSGTEIIVK